MEAVIIKRITEAELAKEIRTQYIKNPPEGMTPEEVRDMDDNELLDMDYFLHEFYDIDDDGWGEEGFYIRTFDSCKFKNCLQFLIYKGNVVSTILFCFIVMSV